MTEFAILGTSAQQVIEPFIERVGLCQVHPFDSFYRFGYRAVGAETVVASVEIPARLVEEMIPCGSRLSVKLTPDGQVISELSFQNHAGSSIEKCSGPLPLDQLIRAALAPQNLHMEEATTEDLTNLLQRLEDSANLVRAALTRCTEDAKQHSAEDCALAPAALSPRKPDIGIDESL
ncbi:hypothetical protein ABIB99_009023 [Bradyrhizobium sp. LA6.1]|uniref:hypothetical protein n=1 Tax=Bradyrhizobium sp. LA6.1 TaxID=3156378 RepID=UPI003399B1C9